MSSKAVAKQYSFTYDEFLKDPDPYNLVRELAQCRTLAIEFRDAITANKAEMRDAFLKVASEAYQERLGEMHIPEEHVKSIAEAADKSYRRVYDAVFNPLSRMTANEAATMAKVIKTTAEISEKYQKIQDGFTVKVEYNDKLHQALMQFIVNVVLPYVPLEQGAMVAAAASNFFPALMEAHEERN